VGAIWGIVDFVKNYPDQRLCFFTPCIDAVEKVYETLLSYLGEDVVGYYHSEAFVDKETELKKQVIVLTHKFIDCPCPLKLSH
jgi:tRNA A58 N-methylase Trm61